MFEPKAALPIQYWLSSRKHNQLRFTNWGYSTLELQREPCTSEGFSHYRVSSVPAVIALSMSLCLYSITWQITVIIDVFFPRVGILHFCLFSTVGICILCPPGSASYIHIHTVAYRWHFKLLPFFVLYIFCVMLILLCTLETKWLEWRMMLVYWRILVSWLKWFSSFTKFLYSFFIVVVGSKVVAIWMVLHQMDFLALGWQISQFLASLQELD